MAMTSKHPLTSRNDIELRVVVKFCVDSNFQRQKTLKLIQNTPADPAHDTELNNNLFDVSLLP